VEHGELPDLDRDIEELERRIEATRDPDGRAGLEKQLEEMKEERGLLRARIDPPFAREDELSLKAQEAAVELDADIP
jgi:hypothetical protein